MVPPIQKQFLLEDKWWAKRPDQEDRPSYDFDYAFEYEMRLEWWRWKKRNFLIVNWVKRINENTRKFIESHKFFRIDDKLRSSFFILFYFCIMMTYFIRFVYGLASEFEVPMPITVDDYPYTVAGEGYYYRTHTKDLILDRSGLIKDLPTPRETENHQIHINRKMLVERSNKYMEMKKIKEMQTNQEKKN